MAARPTPRRGHLLLATLTVAGLVAGVLAVRALLPSSQPVCTATAAGRAVTLNPEQAANAATIAGVAVGRGLPARAVTIALAAALQESKLRNLDHGDLDSLGLFQQRPSQGWGSPAQVRDPVYAAGAFYDALVKVPDYAALPITEAAQRVQRSAAGAAYAAHEADARVLASALTGWSAAGLTCQHLPGVRTAASGPDGPAGGGAPVGTAGQIAQATAGLGEVFGARLLATKATAGSNELTVTVRSGVSNSSQVGWAVASWLVANAGPLRITAVGYDGRRWSRQDPSWPTVPGPTGPVAVVRLRIAG